MNLITIKRKVAENPRHAFPYYNTWELEVGWNRIKLNYTQYTKGRGFTTWYPFSFYWWPPDNQWFRWRILGIRIRPHSPRLI